MSPSPADAPLPVFCISFFFTRGPLNPPVPQSVWGREINFGPVLPLRPIENYPDSCRVPCQLM